MKVTSRFLIEKIAQMASYGNARRVTPEVVLKEVPELLGFDLLALQVAETYQAAQMVLNDCATCGEVPDPILTKFRDDCRLIYQRSVGEDPAEPAPEESIDENPDAESGTQPEDDDLEEVETAPDETEQ